MLEGFRQKHGRAPRVLHIGNIANNAFQNARILNQVDFDCDVICADYYHIMGCPEWEEADFVGKIVDQFRPDWTAVDLRGYQRPKWFAQGPQHLCIDYLIAKRTGDARNARLRWEELGVASKTLGRSHGQLTEQRAHARARWRHLLANLRRYLAMVRERPDSHQLVAHKLRSVARNRRGIVAVLAVVAGPFLHAGVFAIRTVARRPVPDEIGKWRRCFAEAFPDRPDQLTADDCEAHLAVVPRWQSLFAHYDLVLAYSTDGIVPLLAGKPYFAVEHGTIREIPYRQTAEGRRTALCYRRAEHVFVTNFDCLESARFLAPGRYTLINHPFDEDAGLAVTNWETQRADLCRQLDSEHLFFFPTRQDWVPGTGYADKGNDVFLRAFATLRNAGHSVGLVCCRWGANVKQSQHLLEELGCARHVTWIDPLPTVQFERMSRAAHCVVDQFVLGSFGGVTFKAMAVGSPMLTYLDEAQLLRQFPVCPPVINCRTEGQIVEMMSRLLKHPDELARVAAAARDWMRTYHGKAQTIQLQVNQFHSLLTNGAARTDQ